MRKIALLLVLLFTITSAYAQTPHGVSLQCNASTSTGVDSYKIYRAPCTGTVSGGLCSTAGTFAQIGTSPTCSFSDATVKALQKYAYYVTANCSTCSPSESVPSNQVGVAIPADGQPNPPTGLTAPTVAVLQMPGGKTNVLASWRDSPSLGHLSTNYKLTGTRQFWFLKWNVTLVQGSKQSMTGDYSLNWTGPRVSSVTLKVCDLLGCQSKSAS